MINEYLDWAALNKIRTLMLEVIPEIKAEDVKKETILEDICFDTFGMDLLRPKLEDSFNILLSDYVLKSFKTVADIVAYVRKHSSTL